MPEMTDELISKRLNQHLETQLALCDALEKIADSLPNNYCRQDCLRIASQISVILKDAHKFEEEEIFPTIKAAQKDNSINQTLQQLHSDHWEDESFACELQEALFGLVTTPQHANKEALGYMLRGFFGNLRRHVAFETEYFRQRVVELENSAEGVK